MLFHAALVIEPKHSLAANEAGVALARLGRLNEAKLALQHSASLTAHPSTWRNLASVHQSLGEGQLAQLAERESQSAKERWQAQTQATGQLAQGTVQVVDNGTFAQAAPVNTFDSNANRGQQPLANAPAPTPAPPAGQPQPTLADPQVRYAPRQPWGAAADTRRSHRHPAAIRCGSLPLNHRFPSFSHDQKIRHLAAIASGAARRFFLRDPLGVSVAERHSGENARSPP